MNSILYAQASGQASGLADTFGALGNFLPIIAMIVIFYFLLIRPQQKKEKERKKMISEIKSGDRVLTTAGIYGVVSAVKDNDIVVVKIADNAKVEFSRNAIQARLP